MTDNTPKPAGPKTLTVKEEKFCLNYIVNNGNGAAAARDAGYSENSAAEIACENLRKPHIKSFITKKQREMARKADVTPERVIAELAKIAFSNLSDYLVVAPDGSQTLDLNAIARDEAAAISEITQVASGSGKKAKITTKFKLHNKLQALEMLGKSFGLFISKVEHTGKDGGPIEMQDRPYLELARRVAYLMHKADKEISGELPAKLPSRTVEH